jgi:hypothetical protein
LAKIAFWKKQVQPVLKQVQPVLKQVQPVFALFTFLKIPVQPDTQPDTQPVFVWWKQVQPVFALFNFFCQSAVSAKRLCAVFLKNRFNRFWDRFNRFWGRKVKNG